MLSKTMHLVSGVVFALVAVAHLWRLVARTDVVIAGASVPQWLSLVAVVVAGLLAVGNGVAACRCKR